MRTHRATAIFVACAGQLGALACGAPAPAEPLAFAGAPASAVELGSGTVPKAIFPLGGPLSCSRGQMNAIAAAEDAAAPLLDEVIAYLERILPSVHTSEPEDNLFRPFFGELTLSTWGQTYIRYQRIRDLMVTDQYLCPDADEFVGTFGGVRRTCREVPDTKAATTHEGETIRICPLGMEMSTTGLALLIIHETSHQNRTVEGLALSGTSDDDVPNLNSAHAIERFASQFSD